MSEPPSRRIKRWVFSLFVLMQSAAIGAPFYVVGCPTNPSENESESNEDISLSIEQVKVAVVETDTATRQERNVYYLQLLIDNPSSLELCVTSTGAENERPSAPSNDSSQWRLDSASELQALERFGVDSDEVEDIWGATIPPGSQQLRWFRWVDTEPYAFDDKREYSDQILRLVVGDRTLDVNLSETLRSQLSVSPAISSLDQSVPVVSISGTLHPATWCAITNELEIFKHDPVIVIVDELDDAIVPERLASRYRLPRLRLNQGVVVASRPFDSGSEPFRAKEIAPSIESAEAIMLAWLSETKQPIIDHLAKPETDIVEQEILIRQLFRYFLDPEVIESFEDWMHEGDEIVRESIAKEIGNLDDVSLFESLIQLSTSDRLPQVRAAICSACTLIESHAVAIEMLRQLANDENPDVRESAYLALLDFGSSQSNDMLVDFIAKETDPSTLEQLTRKMMVSELVEFDSALIARANSTPSLRPVLLESMLFRPRLKEQYRGDLANLIIKQINTGQTPPDQWWRNVQISTLSDGQQESLIEIVEDYVEAESSGSFDSQTVEEQYQRQVFVQQVIRVLGQAQCAAATDILCEGIERESTNWPETSISLGQIGDVDTAEILRKSLANGDRNDEDKLATLMSLVLLNDVDAEVELREFIEARLDLGEIPIDAFLQADSARINRLLVDCMRDRNTSMRHRDELFVLIPDLFDRVMTEGVLTSISSVSIVSRLEYYSDLDAAYQYLVRMKEESRGVLTLSLFNDTNEVYWLFTPMRNRIAQAVDLPHCDSQRELILEFLDEVESLARAHSDFPADEAKQNVMARLLRAIAQSRRPDVLYELLIDEEIRRHVEDLDKLAIDVVMRSRPTYSDMSRQHYIEEYRELVEQLLRLDLSPKDQALLELLQLRMRELQHEWLDNHDFIDTYAALLNDFPDELYTDPMHFEFREWNTTLINEAAENLPDRTVAMADVLDQRMIDAGVDDERREDGMSEALQLFESLQSSLRGVWYPYDEPELMHLSQGDKLILDRVAGICTDQFLFIQTMPLEEFQQYADRFRRKEYVFHRVCPYVSRGEILVAAIMRRGQHDVRWHTSDTAEELRRQNEVHTEQGLAPLGISGYRLDDQPFFSAIWVGEDFLQQKRLMQVEVENSRGAYFVRLRDELENYRIVNMHNEVPIGGTSSIQSFIAATNNRNVRPRFSYYRGLPSQVSRTASNVIDVCFSDFTPEGQHLYYAISTRDSLLESVFICEQSTEDNLEKGRLLAEAGYLPTGLLTFSDEVSNQIRTSVVWVRPIDKTQRLTEAETIVRAP